MPEGESAWPGVVLIGMALCCDALVANLEEAWFLRAPQPSTQAEVATGLSAISAGYALLITVITGAGPACHCYGCCLGRMALCVSPWQHHA